MHAASCDCVRAIAVLDPRYICFPMDPVLKLVLQKRTLHIAQCTTKFSVLRAYNDNPNFLARPTSGPGVPGAGCFCTAHCSS